MIWRSGIEPVRQAAALDAVEQSARTELDAIGMPPELYVIVGLDEDGAGVAKAGGRWRPRWVELDGRGEPTVVFALKGSYGDDGAAAHARAAPSARPLAELTHGNAVLRWRPFGPRAHFGDYRREGGAPDRKPAGRAHHADHPAGDGHQSPQDDGLGGWRRRR